jgi:hypothetical protein
VRPAAAVSAAMVARARPQMGRSTLEAIGMSGAIDMPPEPNQRSRPMELGNFSISLAVKDLQASKAFYEKLGFKAGHGDGKSWQVMQNGIVKIGLFQGLFERNMLTFNPGWDSNGQPLPSFTDVR